MSIHVNSVADAKKMSAKLRAQAGSKGREQRPTGPAVSEKRRTLSAHTTKLFEHLFRIDEKSFAQILKILFREDSIRRVNGEMYELPIKCPGWFARAVLEECASSGDLSEVWLFD